MTGKLDGKVALISGVGDGIGGAIARRFAAEGASVTCTGILTDLVDAVSADIVAAGGNALSIALNVGSEGDWENAIARTFDAYGLDRRHDARGISASACRQCRWHVSRDSTGHWGDAPGWNSRERWVDHQYFFGRGVHGDGRSRRLRLFESGSFSDDTPCGLRMCNQWQRYSR